MSNQTESTDLNQASGPVLITGATGFVGSHLRVALQAAGVSARLGTRRPDVAEERHGTAGNEVWVHFDVDDETSMAGALKGCTAAYFLVHKVGESVDYPEREKAAARAFGEAARAGGVGRIIYLGGVAPSRKASRHLQSRIETGRLLAESGVPTVEFRAAMVVGHGSASWGMVRDLASRLPAMLLPRWLKRHSWPVSVEDVVFALCAAHLVPGVASGIEELPGPERISHRDVLLLAARHLRKRAPAMLGVPVISPRLSSYWIGFVTSVDLSVARELVNGLVSDLDPHGSVFWQKAGIDYTPTDLATAMSRALQEEKLKPPAPQMRVRLEQIGRALAQRSAQ